MGNQGSSRNGGGGGPSGSGPQIDEPLGMQNREVLTPKMTYAYGMSILWG